MQHDNNFKSKATKHPIRPTHADFSNIFFGLYCTCNCNTASKIKVLKYFVFPIKNLLKILNLLIECGVYLIRYLMRREKPQTILNYNFFCKSLSKTL